MVDYVLVVTMALGNKSYTVGKPVYVPFLNGATFVMNMHLWDGQQS